jgi:hypothetical protein
MALRDSMRASAAPFLRPDETVQAVLAGQTQPSSMVFLTGVLLFYFINHYRMVVATDQRILVLDTGRFSFKKAQSVLFEIPRSTRLGPAHGMWMKLEIGDQKLFVHRRFFKDIDAADQASAAAA